MFKLIINHIDEQPTQNNENLIFSVIFAKVFCLLCSWQIQKILQTFYFDLHRDIWVPNHTSGCWFNYCIQI